jgi:predicted transcriptional regulator
VRTTLSATLPSNSRWTRPWPDIASAIASAACRCALVLDHDRFVGIVTTFDIVAELARYAPAPLDELPAQDVDVEC